MTHTQPNPLDVPPLLSTRERLQTTPCGRVILAIHDAILREDITYDEALSILAAYTRHIGKQCHNEVGVVGLLLKKLCVIIPGLETSGS